ncbi:stress responsive A/B barrel domain-containing protein [Hyaloscypha sp. PMI_1271]|nr:stress responsive A/B barrel domain-containing protein [Hyaloscypha sp. PMI_1271]
MTIIHIVIFKFCPSTTTIQKSSFLTAIKELKSLPSVLDNRLIVGGPSVTDPIEKSKGFDYALLSFHRDREALGEYQASKEHEEVVSTYLYPYKDDVVRFDFEVDGEDEAMVGVLPMLFGNR